MRILLGWELGSNQGHLTCLRQLAGHLKLHGHDVLVAVRTGYKPNEDVAGCATIEGPAWSKAAPAGPGAQPPCASMGDILVASGLLTGGTLRRVVGEWRKVFQEFRPDVVIGEYAPALLCAARGRVRSISVGTGFTSPPAGGPAFPILNPNGQHWAEDSILRNINSNLRSIGDLRLDALPAIFRADNVLLATWPEMDPYRALRSSECYVHPSTSPTLPGTPGAGGNEVFVYSYASVKADSMFWKAVVAPGYPVRVHIRDAQPDHLATFRYLGIHYEPEPLGFDTVAKQSRMVLSHGGHGTVCSAILAGLPVLTAALDLEKLLNGEAAARMGLGQCIPFAGPRAIRVAECINDLLGDIDTAARCKAHAMSFTTNRRIGLEDCISSLLIT